MKTKITFSIVILMMVVVANAAGLKKQYAVTDLATFKSDLILPSSVSNPDTFELTTPGGAYVFSSAIAPVKSIVIRALAGLAAKPVISMNNASSNSTNPFFKPTAASLTFRFIGLELNGVNAGAGPSQPVFIQTANTSTTSNCMVYILNCYVHDFKNTAGNGFIRQDGNGCSIDVQSSIFKSCAGRMLYFNPTSATPASGSCNLVNNTFYSITDSLIGTGNAIVYFKTAAPTTTTVNHCTFYNFKGRGATFTDGWYKAFIAGGTVSVTNSIFDQVSNGSVWTSPTMTVLDSCYLGGYLPTPPTGTNTFDPAIVPAYTNAATLEFTLTNKSFFSTGATYTAGPTNIYTNLIKLTTPAVGSGNAQTSSGFTANWTPVSNASSYLVKVYMGTNLISSTSSTGGASTSSVAISGLMSGITYRYNVTSVGDDVTYKNSNVSDYSANITTTDPDAKANLSTDFGDGTWGIIAPSVPPPGTFSSGSINGFYLNNATINANTTKGPKGESHTNRISLDKNTTNSSVSLPTITSAGQLEIHFAMGSALNSINVREFNATTNIWDLVGNYIYPQAFKDAGMDYIVIVPFVTPRSNAKFKIENNTGGSCYLTQIIARATNPILLTAPTVGTASDIKATTYTASWTPLDANATNYQVLVFKGSTLKITATTTGGQATNRLDITGLQADSIYTYKVKAVGDGDLTYSDSYVSTASASFTMAHQVTTPVLDLPTLINATGFTANWQASINALSYDVILYEGTTYISTTNVIGTSLPYVSLTEGTTYTYKVKAIGDNSIYYDSNISSGIDVTPSQATSLNRTVVLKFIIANGKTILTSETGIIEVFNPQGTQLLQVQAVNKVNTNLNSGLYIVRFTNNVGKQFIQKIIIQ